MGTVINRTTLLYLTSADINKYPTTDWIHNPVLPECEKKYWKIVGDTVMEMSQAEKDVVDTSLEEQAKENLFLGQSKKGIKLITDWGASWSIETWEPSEKSDLLFDGDCLRVIVATIVGCFTSAKDMLENNIIPSGKLTQEIINDYISRLNTLMI